MMPGRTSMPVCMLLLLLTAAAGQEEAKKPSPIRKVVTMIEDMKATVEKEGEEDKAAYDKYACWCQTNDAEKTKAIEDAEKAIEDLSALIEELAGLQSQLKTEIEKLEEDIAKNQQALDTAQAQRDKEKAEFEAQEADLKEALSALKSAVDVLQEVQLMQKQGKAGDNEMGLALLQVRNIVHRNLRHYQDVMQADLWDFLGSYGDGDKGFLPKQQLSALATGENQPIEGGGAAAGAKSYNSRSGQILGMVKQMMETMGKDLADAQKEELTALISFHKLTAAKREEIAAATEQKDAKTEALAKSVQDDANAKQDLEDTKAQMAADQKFLIELKKNCKIEDEAYAARTKIRGDELIALGEVLKILTGDAARDLFARSVGTSFLQANSLSSTQARLLAKQKQARTSAASRILKAAKSTKDGQLALLAVSVKLDKFVKVKKAMDDLLAELKKQQKDEYEKNEFCKKEIDANEDMTKVKTHEKEDLEDKHAELENTISVLTKEIEALNTEVAEMEVSLKRAGEDRKGENADFQAQVADQRAVVSILNMALDRLKMFYEKKGFVQVGVHNQEAEEQAPPPKPKGYEKSGGAGGVMQVIAMIIQAAEEEEQELVHDEQKAQEGYASFVSETGSCVATCETGIAEKSEALSVADADKEETESALLANGEELTKLKDLNIALHADCDFLMENFDIRQTARKEEMDAIVEAKAILSGADFGF